MRIIIKSILLVGSLITVYCHYIINVSSEIQYDIYNDMASGSYKEETTARFNVLNLDFPDLSLTTLPMKGVVSRYYYLGAQYSKALDLLNILDYDVFFDTVICCQNGDMASALLLLDKVITNGFDGQIFLGGLAAHLRNLIICKNARTASLLDVSEDFKKKYLEQAEEIEAGFL